MSHTVINRFGTSLPIYGNTASYTNWSSKLSNYRDQAIFDYSGIQELAIFSTKESLLRLNNLEDNWDGNGSAAPSEAAIQNALGLVEQFYRLATNVHLPWIKPHVTASEDGSVVLEWWKKEHKLTIYITSDSAEYIKVWGPDIQAEMADGQLIGAQFQGLWLWLHA